MRSSAVAIRLEQKEMFFFVKLPYFVTILILATLQGSVHYI